MLRDAVCEFRNVANMALGFGKDFLSEAVIARSIIAFAGLSSRVDAPLQAFGKCGSHAHACAGL